MTSFKATQADKLPTSLTDLLSAAHAEGRAVVLVTGVFDILHEEHMSFLAKAKQAGDLLVVGLESDQRVRQIKGSGRPVNSETERRQNLWELGIADFVFILPDDFSQPQQHRQLIETIRPAALAVSSHTKHLDKKSRILESVGGKLVVVHDFNPSISTTILMNGME